VDVRFIAVATTCGSGIGAATMATAFESEENAEAIGTSVPFGVVAIGVAAGVATGLKSVVASTTI
jgi:hypothetical protein